MMLLEAHSSGLTRLGTPLQRPGALLVAHGNKVLACCRARCSEILEEQEAFRARAKPQTVYEAETAKGRPLLPVVRTVEAIVEELMQWARLMPKFADRLTGKPRPLVHCLR